MNRASKVRVVNEEKNKNPLNNSKSKAQYSFNKAERFPRAKHHSTANIQFYNLPSQTSKRNTTFGYGRRSSTISGDLTFPSPTKYNVTP